MLDVTRLDIATPGGGRLPNTFLRSDARSSMLAVLFPGRGYRATMPLLHYSQAVLLSRGADVLRLDLAYDVDPAFQSAAPAERRDRLRDDARAAFETGVAQGSYRHVVLVGKSLGTLALADLLQLPSPALEPACVWLTPLLNDDALIEACRTRQPPSLYVIGTADPLYDACRLDALAALPESRAVVIPDADHGLEVTGDMVATLQAMGRYLSALERFLDAVAGVL